MVNIIKQEIAIIENNIKELERKILETEQIEEIKFTKEDILIKRDIDYINKIKWPNLFFYNVNKLSHFIYHHSQNWKMTLAP